MNTFPWRIFECENAHDLQHFMFNISKHYLDTKKMRTGLEQKQDKIWKKKKHRKSN